MLTLVHCWIASSSFDVDVLDQPPQMAQSTGTKVQPFVEIEECRNAGPAHVVGVEAYLPGETSPLVGVHITRR